MLNDLKSQLGHTVQSVRSLFERPPRAQPGSAQPTAPDTPLQRRQREERHVRVRTMQADLFQLLDQHPDTRKLMRHLALVEFTLRYQGLNAMQGLPRPVLARALFELEKLVWDWSTVGLAELRSRLAVLVKSAPAADPVEVAETAATAAAGPPSLPYQPHVIESPSGPDVTELDHAAFAEMERSWAGQTPQAAVQARHNGG